MILTIHRSIIIYGKSKEWYYLGKNKHHKGNQQYQAGRQQ